MGGIAKVCMAVAAAVVFASLAACSHDASSDTAADGPDTGIERPSIHYDQISVLTVDGAPQEEQSYRSMLDACQKSGMAMQALSPEDAAKIGRVHVEAWIDKDRSARHQEEWHQDLASPCHFTLVHQDETDIMDAQGRSTHIDGVTLQGDVQETGGPMPVNPLPADDGQLTDAQRQAGWSRQGQDTLGGATCEIWQNAVGTRVCVWSGGRAWGFSAQGVDVLSDGTSHDGTIVLWSRPGKGSAWSLETRAFVLGQLLDPSVFEVPANVRMQ